MGVAALARAAQPVSGAPARAGEPAQKESQPADDSASRLVMRSGREAPTGRVERVTDEGVVVVDPGRGERVVPLHFVRAVEGPLSDAFEARRSVADDLWRATSRLDRGDAVSAEPIFEALFEARSKGGASGAVGEGPTSLAIADGLLRCRLRAGAMVSGASAWLAIVAVRPRAEDLPASIDPETLLCPDLPPIFVDVPSMRSSGAGLDAIADRADGSSVARALAILYRHELSRAIEPGNVPALPTIETTQPGVTLVLAMVRARDADAGVRVTARASLAARAAERPGTWVEAWARIAIARSLAMEGDHESAMRAVAEYLRVPSTLAGVSPSLSGVALAEAGVVLSREGEAAGARALKRELVDGYPGHPAIGMGGLRSIPASEPEGRAGDASGKAGT
jgi:hypothetical protein